MITLSTITNKTITVTPTFPQNQHHQNIHTLNINQNQRDLPARRANLNTILITNPTQSNKHQTKQLTQLTLTKQPKHIILLKTIKHPLNNTIKTQHLTTQKNHHLNNHINNHKHLLIHPTPQQHKPITKHQNPINPNNAQTLNKLETNHHTNLHPTSPLCTLLHHPTPLLHPNTTHPSTKPNNPLEQTINIPHNNNTINQHTTLNNSNNTIQTPIQLTKRIHINIDTKQTTNLNNLTQQLT